MNNAKQEMHSASDSIAIIGMACRFPGANNAAEFWQNLRNGVESLSIFPDSVLEASGIDAASLKHPNYVKVGAILKDIELMDATFFGLTAQEAEMMDPQHRLFLECAWEALENAGYSPEATQGSVGVFAGSRISEYLLFNQVPPDLAGLTSGSLVTHFQRLVANDKDYLATRVSFKLNLKGPSITVQSACSTSLVAVHLACESLLNGQCDIALAGGAAVRVPQRAGYFYSEGMIFSPDGHTRAFDTKAGGTIFSSGVGVVALKRLDDALADRDWIHAVIVGTAINNDGSSTKSGFTAPSVDGQAAVITEALSVAHVEPEMISYLETHGTGTPLGDTIEIAALNQVFRAKTPAQGFCAIGSVKTNIGHTCQAAGIAGLIKTVLMLRHKLLVPSLNFDEPNPQIEFVNSPFYVNTALTEWTSDETPRCAGVSSFGIGGTNAHVVLEEAPVVAAVQPEVERPWHLLCLSAKSEGALRELASRYERYLAVHPSVSLGDVCFTAHMGRSHFTHRVSVVADSLVEMSLKLAAFAGGEKTRGVLSPQGQLSHRQSKVAWLFTGQGSQYVNMGRQLYNTQPTFRRTLDQCDALLRPYLKQSLLAIIYPERRGTSPLDDTAYTQPAIFALEYALAQVWRSWGIEPEVVMGHSVGEYVAACVAGVLSLEDGLKLIAERGRLMQALPTNGAMAAVFTDEARVTAAVAPQADLVSIAAINGPENIVISGEQRAVQLILKQLESEGIQSQWLRVSHAFHSPLMASILDPFERIASDVRFASPQIKLISNVTGQLADQTIVTRLEYWRHHIREIVRFSEATKTLYEQGCEIFIEIGPHPALLGMGQRCLPEGVGLWLPSLRQGRDDWQQMLQSLGALYVHGLNVDWGRFDRDYPRRRVELPTYPFQRQRYWIEPATHYTKQPVAHAPTIMQSRVVHPLLGNRLHSPLQQIQFESQLSITSAPFLRDHRVHDTVILPATAFVEMLLVVLGRSIHTDSGRVSYEPKMAKFL
jgi:acyl transferase domain-containing protein